MGKEELNKDYVLTIVEKKGRLLLQNVPVVHEYVKLIDFLNKKIKDNKYSIFQMEDDFFSSLPRWRHNHYSYAFPNDYYQSYVTVAECPNRTTQEKLDKALSKYSSHLRKINYIKSLKRDFVEKATRYIWALEFYRTIDKLKDMPEVKMYSHDMAGWKEFCFKINEEIQVIINSNFTYGYSSYFTVTIKYKDIIIVPYTHLVEYYHARAIDIIRCTETFFSRRCNWINVMNLVVNASNTAKVSSRSFIHKYILEECKRMIYGLRKIKSDPQSFYRRIASVSHHELELIFVSDRSNEEKETYGIYPDEVVFAFRCEKISGALHFLDSLNSLAEYIPEINAYIDEIKSMNSELIPQIAQRIVKIEREIENAENKLEELRAEEKEIDNKLSIYEPTVDLAVKKVIEIRKTKGESYVDFLIAIAVRNQLEELNEDYKHLRDRQREIPDEIQKIKSEVSSRKGFIIMLNRFMEEIKQHIIKKTA